MKKNSILRKYFLLIPIFCLRSWAGAVDQKPIRLFVCVRESLSTINRKKSALTFNQLSSGLQKSFSQLSVLNVSPLIPGAVVSPKKIRALSFEKQNSYARDLEKLQRVLVVTLPSDANLSDSLKKLNQNPLVEYAEEVVSKKISRSPNDTDYTILWGLQNTGQAGISDSYDSATGTPGKDIDAELAWNTQIGSTSTVIAVIDTGVDWAHPDLANNIWSNSGEPTVNGVDDDSNGYIDDIHGWDFGVGDNNPTDDCFNSTTLEYGFHGTHVSGIISAVGNNGTDVVGVNWKSKIMPLKISNATCDLDTVAEVQALNYAATNGADVINMSFGGQISFTEQTAINAAYNAGVVLIAAAGNEDTVTLSYPAAYSTVIAVAATDRNDHRASFSNFGSWVDISAPGVAIRSTFPTVWGKGSTAYLDGTSMASPMVAGVAGLILSQYPTLTVDQVYSRITSSAENIDIRNPGYTGLLGTGRVNAARALISVSTISPSFSVTNATVAATIGGISFVPGMTVQLSKAGKSPIYGSSILISSSQITCNFDLTGASTGSWNVSVWIEQTTQTLSSAFFIQTIGLDSVSPSSATNTGSSGNIILNGHDFVSNMTVKLSKSGQSDVASNSFQLLTSTAALITFNLTGVSGGKWDVVVVKDGVNINLRESFIVNSPTYKVPALQSGQNYDFSISDGIRTHTISWPSGIISQETNLELIGSPNLPTLNSSIDPFKATGIGVQITAAPILTALSKSFSMSLNYRVSDLPDQTKEDALTIGTYNTATNRWEPIPSVIDAISKKVTANISHLSYFALLQHVPSAEINQMVVFPNPFRPTSGHQKITFDFLTAGARVRIFDQAGELVEDLVDENQDGQIFWDVTNIDHEKVVSGIYTYLVTDPKGNKKTGHLGVLR